MRSPIHPGQAAHPRQAGFSMVEVLVAIVILSFGLLGMAGLQAASLQANRDARLQSIAVGLARELTEMMRGNKDIALLSTNNPYLGSFITSPLAPAAAGYCLGVGNSCATSSDVAASQLTDWLARVDAELPGARVTICTDAAPYDSSNLPRWACTGTTAAPIIVKIGWTRGSTRSASASLDEASRPSVVLFVTPGSSI
ncbi:type IV pilus modification protein PilV [Variovorax sp. JS1663]|uniref:type IV pilus modification protein PilV n=1 Tax=Variovorax sp. JS1663 TaxID=1851577 RepID=UPI000B347B12|nr:type IV pilus modification protein PilV [Variovorax sp. JS1663]OUM03889.1 type IV pilus modification protein PilV [Variovorax sp. JS1663]